MSDTHLVSIRIPVKLHERMSRVIEAGNHMNHSDLIRSAIMFYLLDYE